MTLIRLKNLLADTWLACLAPASSGTAGVSPAASDGFTRLVRNISRRIRVSFHKGGRDTRGPSEKLLALLLLTGTVTAILLLLADDAIARVGGGHSYSGGGSHSSGGSRGGGSSGGGGDGGAILGLIRMLAWLTVEHPVVGVPVDVAIVGFFVWRFAKGSKNAVEAFASGSSVSTAEYPLGLDTPPAGSFNREFAQLRKFDPNFSEIVFTDFCYALYGKAHDARGHGPKALDQFSPYL